MKENNWVQQREDMLKMLELMERKEDLREKEENKNNTVIKGCRPSSSSLKEEIENLLVESMHVRVEIMDAHTMKIAKGAELVIAKLSNFESKCLIMKNKNKIDGSELCINNDHTYKERQIQNQIHMGC